MFTGQVGHIRQVYLSFVFSSLANTYIENKRRSYKSLTAMIGADFSPQKTRKKLSRDTGYVTEKSPARESGASVFLTAES